jgi:hypothetical protein
MRVRSWQLLVALAAVVALAAGCGWSNGSEPGNASEDAVGSSTPPGPSPSVEDDAVAAYVAMWEDTAVAARTSDVDHPRLDDHATDAALMLLQYVMRDHAEDGHVARGAPRHDVLVVKSSRDRRELQDCMDGTDWLMYKRNGELVNDIPGSHRRVDATVERRGHEWMVTDLLLHERATC